MRDPRTQCTFRHHTAQYYLVCVCQTLAFVCMFAVHITCTCTGCVRITRADILGGAVEPPGSTWVQASAPPYVHRHVCQYL